VYAEWAAAEKRGHREAKEYCKLNFVNDRVMREVRDTRRQFVGALESLGFNMGSEVFLIILVPPPLPYNHIPHICHNLQADDYGKKPRVLQAVLCAGLYPNVAKVKAPQQKYQENIGTS